MPWTVFLVALLAVASPANQQDQSVKENLFVGNWTANLSKSKQSPSYQFKSATLQVAVDRDTVTMASVVVNASGQEQRSGETFRTDGTETPGTHNPGVILIGRWVGPHVLATVAMKGGVTFGLVTYEVSADGKTLTLRSSGSVEHVLVFERQ